MFAGTIGLALGEVHSLLLNKDGSAWSSGMDTDGQLGLDSTDFASRNFMQAIPGGVNAVAAGAYHSILLMSDNSVWATGKNDKGQLGDGTRSNRNIFGPIKDATYSCINEFLFRKRFGAAKAIAAGGYHSMVLTSDGAVWTAGWNRYGQLGSRSNVDQRGFCVVITKGITAMAAGESHSLVMARDGHVWATGGNVYGQLGDKTTEDKNRFVQVIAGGAKAIAAGGYHSMVLMQDGTVLAAGSNSAGQLGDGMPYHQYSTTFKLMRYYAWQKPNSSGAKAIAAGGFAAGGFAAAREPGEGDGGPG